MKKIALAAAIAGSASSAFAGGMAAPVVEMTPTPIVQETKASSSSAAIIIPLILITLIALAANK